LRSGGGRFNFLTTTLAGLAVTRTAEYIRLNWRRLVWLTDAELDRHDIAAVNLDCAEGLPDANGIDVASCLRRLDEWAGAVRGYPERSWQGS
jgi:hypothetical protein